MSIPSLLHVRYRLHGDASANKSINQSTKHFESFIPTFLTLARRPKRLEIGEHIVRVVNETATSALAVVVPVISMLVSAVVVMVHVIPPLLIVTAPLSLFHCALHHLRERREHDKIEQIRLKSAHNFHGSLLRECHRAVVDGEHVVRVVDELAAGGEQACAIARVLPRQLDVHSGHLNGRPSVINKF